MKSSKPKFIRKLFSQTVRIGELEKQPHFQWSQQTSSHTLYHSLFMFSRFHDEDHNEHEYSLHDENKISLNVTGIRNLVSEVSKQMHMNILRCKITDLSKILPSIYFASFYFSQYGIISLFTTSQTTKSNQGLPLYHIQYHCSKNVRKRI